MSASNPFSSHGRPARPRFLCRTGLIRCSRDFRYSSANAAYAELVGFPIDQIIGRRKCDILGQAGFERLEPYIKRVLAGEQLEFEIEIPLTSGTKFIHAAYTPETDLSGEIVGWFGSVTDVSLQRSAEETLARQAERQALLLEITRDMIGAGTDLAALTDTVFRKAGPHINADVCINYRLNEAGTLLKLVAAYGVSPEVFNELQTLKLGQAFCGTVAQTCRPLSADANRISTDDLGCLVRSIGLRSYACQPLFSRDGTVLGTLSMGSRARDSFAAEEIEFLQTICHFMALAWERAQAQQALAQAMQLLDAHMDNSPLAVIEWGSDMRLTRWSKEAEVIFGWTAEEVLGKQMWDFKWIYEADATEVHEVSEDLQTGIQRFSENRNYRKDGSVLLCRWYNSTLLDENGEFRSILSLVLDVTEQHQAQQALIDGERSLRLALEAGRMGSWNWDVTTSHIDWSDGHYTLLGYKPREVPASYGTFRSRVHPEDLERQEHELRESMEQRRDYRVDFRVVWPDGSVHWLAARGRYVYDEEDRPVRMYGVIADIDQAKQAEAELLKAKDEAESASRAKDHFLAVLSHELRTPLNPALMAAAITEMSPQLPPDLRENVAIIRRNIELETRLIDDMLDLTRITRGKVTLSRKIIDGCEALRHAVETCQAEAQEKGICLDLSLPDAPIPIYADPARLQQVFWNVLKNAVKFTPDHGKISVNAAAVEHGRLRVEITDTGKGIEAEALERIFDAFEQAGTAITRRFGGLGLGLAICKGLLQLHGGSISASSPGPGRGSTFAVELPLAEIQKPQVQNTSDGSQPKPGQLRLQRRRILVVEDHQSTAAMMQKLLQGFGHEVAMANCVQRAVEKFAEGNYDLLISDLGLPDGSGEDLLRRLSTNGPVKAIALSGYGMKADIQQSEQAGFLEHLVKPVDVELLRASIARVLGESENPSESGPSWS